MAGTKLPKDVGQSMRESVTAKAEATVEALVGMIERGELRLPEMQRRYVWRSTRVRDLLDSLYRGYPSGAILLWETDGAVPLQEFAVAQQGNPYQSTRLLLDGQQRLTSLSAVIRGGPVNVRVRKRPIELLFNLEYEAAAGEVVDERFVDRRALELEVVEVLGERQLGDGELVLDRAGLLLVDLGVEQVADNALGFVLTLDGSRHDLVEGSLHAVELEFAHEIEQLSALH
jgi:hypothetical protein